MVNFIIDPKGKSINLYDGGDRVFSTTSLSTIGKAVAGVLTHSEQTKNRTVYVHDTATTLKKLAAMGKKATGAAGWNESFVPIDEVIEQAWAELKKDNPNPEIFAYNFIKASIWGEGYGCYFEKPNNKLLGITEMSDVEVQGLVDVMAN